MKTPRELAIEATHIGFGLGISRAMFAMMLDDDSDLGRGARKMVDAIERVIIADRQAQEKARMPS